MTKYTLIFSAVVALALQGCSLKDKSKAEPDMTQDTTETTEVNGGYLQIMQAQKPNEGQLNGQDLNTVKIKDSPLALEFPDSKMGVVDSSKEDKKEDDSKVYKRYIVSDAFYKQTRFGITNTDKEVFVFAQGHPTLQMPKQGQAIYNGHAAVNLEDYLGTATAISNVDFEKNTLQVKISTPEEKPREINFEAVIRGNTFAGDKEIISSGGFYGKDAAELGGYFIKDAKNYGAFGGKKFFGIK